MVLISNLLKLIKITSKNTSKCIMIAQDIYLGIDSGNGRVKALSSNGFSIRVPSLLYFPQTLISPKQLDNESAYVVYESGLRSDLWNKSWIVGKEAYVMAPDSHISTSDDKEAKVKFCLELLLGASAQVVSEKKVTLTIALSIHDKEAFKDSIRSKLEGIHRVKLNGKSCELTVSVVSLVDEGLGAYYELLATKKASRGDTALLLDIGHGTIITSVFGSSDMKFRQTYPLGVSKLYSAIANNVQIRKALKGTPGNLQLIKQGIERGDFVYGNNQRLSFEFKNVYQDELKPWVSNSLAKVLSSLTQWQNEATHLFCIGGGVQLPGIKGFLEKQHFLCLDEAEWLNTRGLLRIAQRKG